MYKIYNREIEKDLKFKNLNEVERHFISEKYRGEDLQKYSYVEEYKINDIEIVVINTGKDYYGNPLHMFLFFKGGRCIKSIRSKQSYNTRETSKYLINKID